MATLDRLRYVDTWAIALKQSDGSQARVDRRVRGRRRRLARRALDRLQRPGSAYAVWTGIGTIDAARVGVLALGEPATTLRGLGIALIVGVIVALLLAEVG